MLFVDELLKCLQEKLCRKAIVYSETSACIVIVCRRRDEDDMLLLAVATHNNYIYAKMVPEKTHKFEWVCSNIFYNPCGLYAFAENVGELVRKLEEKIEMVEAMTRYCRV